MNLKKISDTGDELATLKALRARIAESIDNTQSGRDMAALSRQLQIIMARIKEVETELKSKEEDTVLDIVRRHHKIRNSNGQVLRDSEE